MKIGDVVTIKRDAGLRHIDYARNMLGNTYVITDMDTDEFIQVDYDGGWWVNVEAVESVNSKTKIEHKIAVMYKRFANRKGN